MFPLFPHLFATKWWDWIQGRWHHRLKGHEFEQAPGVGDGQGSLVYCSPWVLSKLATTEWPNWAELKAEVDVFLELSCFFYEPTNVGNLISGSSVFSKSSLYIWKFSVYVLLKSGMDNFEHYFANMWNECNYAVVWTFFVIALLWDWNENWHSLVLQPLLSFPNLLAYWVWHFHSIIF